MWIKAVLLGLMVLALLFFVRQWYGVRMQAGKRLAFFAFIAINALAIVRPDDVTWVANRLGVGRGADLVLYLLVVAFVLAMLNTYLRFREMDRRYTELTRTLAIREAELVNRERGLLPLNHEHATVLPTSALAPSASPPSALPASALPTGPVED
jgi:small membrane protein